MTRRVLFLLFICIVSVQAQERIVLETPVYVSSGVRDFRVQSLTLLRGPINPTDTSPGALPPANVTATFMQVNDATGEFIAGGKTLVCSYTGSEAEMLIRQLNTLDLRTNSLEKRVTQRCQTDGKIGPGTVTGTPQE